MDLASVGEEAREEHSMDRLQSAQTATDHDDDDAVASDTLVEEVSIDGMCGVY